ncbi:MAG: hypothetical protein US62_C0002G0003 [Candidatus Woesebacteria bacterium GW2011_GWA1_37_8]|uniref:Glycosyltransferase RgtA/B/C/D-like domain-containing protein n=2 Tax=Candidatus Woeseibacteriota TaxID=1752722 RepID=A0A0G0I5R9_9BACT|nr:MAG: hypothetical protein US62_C0002G0003 [Candidatus Woesebacteria bacterium GW2011_GWA1_37_8]
MIIAFKKYSMIVGIFCAAHIAILSKLKFFPYPELFIYSYLTKGGLIPYKQIFDQHFPGLMFLPVNFASLGIDTVAEMRIVSYLLVVLSHLAIYKISKTILKNNKLLLLPNLLFLIWHPSIEGYVLWIDSFAQTTLLWSFYFLLRKGNKNSFLTGLLLGLTFLLKQTVAPLILLLGLYLFFKTKSKKTLFPELYGFLICVLALFVWIFALGVWKDFYYWTFIFNITTFAQMGRKTPQIMELIKIAPVFVLPALSLIYMFFKRTEKQLKYLLIFYFGAIFFALARFDYVHLQPALPFAILTLIYLVQLMVKKHSYIVKYTLLFLVFSIVWNAYLLRHFIGSNTYFFGRFESQLTSEVNKYRSSGKVFAFGTTPHIYYLTKTLPPGNIFAFQFPWFMKIAEEKVYYGLVNDPPAVVIRDKNAQVSGMNLVKNMPKISDYVNKYYKTVEVVGDTELMVRN